MLNEQAQLKAIAQPCVHDEAGESDAALAVWADTASFVLLYRRHLRAVYSYTYTRLVNRQVRAVDIAESRSWLEALLEMTASKAEAKGRTNGASKSVLVSIDGKQLYVGGHTLTSIGDVEEQPTGLQVIEVDTGRKVASLDTVLVGLRSSPDGGQMFLSGLRDRRQVTEVLDAQTLKQVATIEDWRVSFWRSLNGQPLLMATQRMETGIYYGLMDPQTFKVGDTWTTPGNMSMIWRTR